MTPTGTDAPRNRTRSIVTRRRMQIPTIVLTSEQSESRLGKTDKFYRKQIDKIGTMGFFWQEGDIHHRSQKKRRKIARRSN